MLGKGSVCMMLLQPTCSVPKMGDLPFCRETPHLIPVLFPYLQFDEESIYSSKKLFFAFIYFTFLFFIIISMKNKRFAQLPTKGEPVLHISNQKPFANRGFFSPLPRNPPNQVVSKVHPQLQFQTKKGEKQNPIQPTSNRERTFLPKIGPKGNNRNTEHNQPHNLNHLKESNYVFPLKNNSLHSPLQKMSSQWDKATRASQMTDSMIQIHEQIDNPKQENLLRWIRSNVIGLNTRYVSELKLELETLYVDHTATNRPFKAIETAVSYFKLHAANPHTQFSFFGKYSTELMHAAQKILLSCLNAPIEKYVALPTGSGCTGAIQKALNILKSTIKEIQPEIFITPYEHHSNILPWIQFFEHLSVLEHDEHGNIIIEKFEDQLTRDKKPKIVSISAASNVTSQETELKQINSIIKKIRNTSQQTIYFAIDCAAFCCHHHLNLTDLDQVDFAFLSPHKNLGGAESCGVLISNRSLIPLKPTFPGGGTVQFVKGYKKSDVGYHQDAFETEISGTPPFIGFYRAALSFELLTRTIGYGFIEERETANKKVFYRFLEKMKQQLKQKNCPTSIHIYGGENTKKKANVVTFNFTCNDELINHNFISLVFSDLFGIQLRSGCFCAGPFGITLLKLTEDRVETIKNEVEAGILINKPGFLRMDLTFYLEDYEIEYLVKVMVIVAKYWKNLMKLYTVCNSGQVKLLNVFNDKSNYLFSLADINIMNSKLKKDREGQTKKQDMRIEMLNFQLKRGEDIAKDPVNFIQSIRKNQSFKIPF